MINESKDIDGKEVNVKAWGFLTLMPIKRKLLSIVASVAPNSIDLINGVGDESGDIDTDAIIKTIVSAVEAFDEKTLKWFMKTMLGNVTVDGQDMSKDAIVDEVLRANSLLFYKIVYFVVEVNFGDFFQMLKTRLDSSAYTENELKD